MNYRDQLLRAADMVAEWERSWGTFEPHPALAIDPEKFSAAWEEYTERMKENYPFFHPRYAGQMLKPPHPVAVVGYLAAMLINPNNHALDGGPATGQMEKEVVQELSAMFRLPDETLGHLTGGGTMANLEALWIARELAPGKAIAFCENAHYTHGRMCALLGVRTVVIPADASGRMDMTALEEVLRGGDIGTVVLTAGTTGLGVVDAIDEVLAMRDRYGCRIHVDAAYGGFFVLLAHMGQPPVPAAPLRAIAACDSVVVDPHKHGLQPYGCGCVLFRDPAVGRFYRHDSPYTYFTSGDLHLGEISLECSRPGAAAGALWLTLRLLPLKADEGFGPILAAGLNAAQRWAAWLEISEHFRLYLTPELDIVSYFPEPVEKSLQSVDASSHELFESLMHEQEDPFFLSTYRMEARRLHQRFPDLACNTDTVRILRSVLMKPEHELFVEKLHRAVERTRTPVQPI